ncbi:hypothetical protein [Pandoraea pnomenusa]|uniref:hypothetical protein n=1 Tax=Pandoraea pnomenusa TaxID=93220 RepID=UPI001AC65136|nr:hypothetical protein [Pandoraea pnomenusa]MBN9095283.1 hypothetical protein [Pandoraea pnomenusa]
MTAINALSRSVTLASAEIASRAASASAADAPPVATGPSASTWVTLTTAPPLANWPTYTQPVANGATLYWQTPPSDPLSLLMSGNASTHALGNRLDSLGRKLLDVIAGGATAYSQSVLRSSTVVAPSADALAVQRTQLQTDADNRFALTIKTASGAQVSVRLGSSDDGLSAEVAVTKGTLTDAERDQLGKLADAFQRAVDGLGKQPPVVDFGALTGFDTALLSSVDLSATLGANGTSAQTIAFHADATQRNVHVDGASGRFEVNVDLQSMQAVGSPKAQAAALDAWLARFDIARTRGNGDASLMQMFKGAFTGLNGHYPPAPALPRIALSSADKSVLSGLADFSASISQTTSASNPLRPSEVDGFDYRISQHTDIGGKDTLNRTVAQQAEATLTASYHRSLWAGVPLNLTTDPKSQNYEYVKVHDSANTDIQVGYRDGLPVRAAVHRSADQSTQVQRFEMARLVSDVITPQAMSQRSDLTTLLASVLRSDVARPAPPAGSDGAEVDDAARAEIRRRTALEIDPARLRVVVRGDPRRALAVAE